MLIMVKDHIEEISPGQTKVYPFEVNNKYLILQNPPKPEVNTVKDKKRDKSYQ